MLYIMADEKIFLNPLKLIGKGTEGKVYKYKDSAIKIYYNNVKNNHEESDSILKTIKTEYIILPKTEVYSLFGNYRGHQMKYMDFSSNKSFVDTKVQEFSDSLHVLIDEDISAISSENFLMYDMGWNMRFNGKMYIIDSGRYVHIDKAREITNNTYEDVYDTNLGMFKDSLRDFTINELFPKQLITPNIYSCIKDLIGNIEDIDKRVAKDETIRQYVLKHTR